MKKLLTILAAGFFFLSAYTFARSEECANPFTTLVEAVTSVEGTVKPITDAERAQLYEKKGPPPIDEPFTIAIARAGDMGLIAIVKDDCIVGRIGPAPLFLLENLLGNTGA